MDNIAVCEIIANGRRATFAVGSPTKAHAEGRRVAVALKIQGRAGGYDLKVDCFEFVAVKDPVMDRPHMEPRRIKRYV